MKTKVLLFTIAATVVVVMGSALPALASGGGSEEPKTYLGIPEGIWLPLNLCLFLFLLGRWIWPSLRGFLDTRGDAIRSELEEAQRKLGDAEELRTQVLNRLEQVESEVSEIKVRAEREGSSEAERIGEQARNEEERFLKRVEDEINRRTAETRKELAEETATLTAQLTKDLLSKEMTDKDRKRVMERSLTAMQAMRES